MGNQFCCYAEKINYNMPLKMRKILEATNKNFSANSTASSTIKK